jgi:hypothetical protein
LSFKLTKYFTSTINSKKYYSGLDPWSFRDVRNIMWQQRESNKILNIFIGQDRLKLPDVENRDHLVIYAHLEPESTHFPEGGKFSNVIDLVIKIRSLGHQDQIIFKEHPAFRTYATGGDASKSGMARSLHFYKTLRRLGCIFVDSNFMAGPRGLVITLTGTVGLERSLDGLETIVMGHIWFAGMPGCLTLREGIDRLNGRAKFSRKEIRSGAQKFVLETLNFNSIKNPTGIGTLITSEDTDTRNAYRQQIERLIDYLSYL